MTNEELLAEAKRRYPVGTIFRVAHIIDKICTIKDHKYEKNTFVNNSSGLHINFLINEIDDCNMGSVYFNGEWAEIISLPKDIKYDYVIF